MNRRTSLAVKSGFGARDRVSRGDLLKATAAGGAGIVAVGLARPATAIGAIGGGHKGNLGAITKQLKGTGLFIGNEFVDWSNATRRDVFARIRGWKFDFVCPKVGGYGSTWYSSDQELRDCELGPRCRPRLRTVHLLGPRLQHP